MESPERTIPNSDNKKNTDNWYQHRLTFTNHQNEKRRQRNMNWEDQVESMSAAKIERRHHLRKQNEVPESRFWRQEQQLWLFNSDGKPVYLDRDKEKITGGAEKTQL